MRKRHQIFSILMRLRHQPDEDKALMRKRHQIFSILMRLRHQPDEDKALMRKRHQIFSILMRLRHQLGETGRSLQTSLRSIVSEKSLPAGENDMRATWFCKRCKQNVSNSGKRHWQLRGDLVIRHRCPSCNLRHFRAPTKEERETQSVQVPKRTRKGPLIFAKERIRSRREKSSHRRELKKYSREFLIGLNQSDFLSEVARQEGNWRSS